MHANVGSSVVRYSRESKSLSASLRASLRANPMPGRVLGKFDDLLIIITEVDNLLEDVVLLHVAA